MKEMPSLFIILSQIIPLSIMILGILLNIMVVLVFTNKNLIDNFQPAVSMTVLAINDIFALFSLVMNTNTYWTPQLNILNNASCKIFSFMIFFFQAMSCWITAFISIERTLSLWCRETNIKKNFIFKVVALTCIHLWNFLFYSPTFVFDELKHSNNSTNLTMPPVCGPKNAIAYDFIIYSNLVNSIIVCFSIMIICSCIIIKNLHMIRKSVGLQQDEQIKRRDIKFSVSIVFLDIIFVGFHTPLLVIQYFPNASYVLLYALVNIYLLRYGVNIFIYLSFYEKFREKFFYIFFNVKNLES